MTRLLDDQRQEQRLQLGLVHDPATATAATSRSATEPSKTATTKAAAHSATAAGPATAKAMASHHIGAEARTFAAAKRHPAAAVATVTPPTAPRLIEGCFIITKSAFKTLVSVHTHCVFSLLHDGF